MSRKDDFCVFCGKDVPQRTITQVMDYLQHRPECRRWVYPTDGSRPWLLAHTACTCGLDDLAAVLSGSREQEKISLESPSPDRSGPQTEEPPR
jgi:hypothetical protein